MFYAYTELNCVTYMRYLRTINNILYTKALIKLCNRRLLFRKFACVPDFQILVFFFLNASYFFVTDTNTLNDITPPIRQLPWRPDKIWFSTARDPI